MLALDVVPSSCYAEKQKRRPVGSGSALGVRGEDTENLSRVPVLVKQVSATPVKSHLSMRGSCRGANVVNYAQKSGQRASAVE
jgi:hypothetical protein